jgi:hypothetical protein
MREPYTSEFIVGRHQERHCIHLCEMKFSQDLFAVDRQVSLELARKQRVFQLRTQTKKTLFLTMITAQGLKPNSYAEQIPCQVSLEELFRM